MTHLKLPLAFLLVAFALLFARGVRADDAHCTGAEECCPEKLADHFDHVVTVKPGIVVLGIANVNEKAGTWDADFYLYEEWPPTPGFTPRTDVVNEVTRTSTTFDDTSLRDGTCTRSRRIHSTLRSEFNLRTFPFDEQHLTLRLSDDQYDSKRLVYGDHPHVMGVDDAVRTMVSGWKVMGDPSFSRVNTVFKWEPGAPSYDYGTFAISVRRHVAFHLTRYFLPLLVIVCVAFSAFWIDPEDLNSQMQVGVTCLLAAIALQFAEAGTLPEVSYLTLADRLYAVCYVVIATSIIESVIANALVRRGKRDTAMRVDRLCRRLLPAVLLVALAASTMRAFQAT